MSLPVQLNLLWELTITHQKLRDQSSFFGFLWSFLHPLVLLAVFYVFFRYMAGNQMPHYSVYLLIGLVHYTHFSNSTKAALRSLRSMRHLTTDTVFPKELIVFSWIISSGIDFAVSMAICLIIAVVSGVTVTVSWLWVPVLFALQLLFAAWVGLILSCLYLFAWDVDHLYEIALRLLFFTTPIFYTRQSLANGLAQAIVELNPLAWIIEATRGAVLDGQGMGVGMLAAAVGVNCLAMYGVMQLFRRLESRFAEYA